MVAIYTLTSVISAFLVFLIQPVVAKLALPTLGGTPAVWSGCMLFFQAVLLMGYLYAHLLTGRVALRAQPVVHLLLFSVVVALLPMQFNGADGVDPVYHPLPWLLTMLLFSVGLPYFVISATSPLLQRWFSFSGHKDAGNPYFLYAASNIGSMGALLLYPFAIEPFASLAGQVAFWEKGVMLLGLCFAGVGIVVWKCSVTEAEAGAEMRQAAEQPIAWRQRMRWLALAFIPSSLLYGVTSYITTDIASVPMLWIIPLALYLLTFIMVFATRPRGIDTALILHVPMVVLLCLLMAIRAQFATLGLLVHVLGLFVIALALHGLLARNKPAPEHLTEFFLWVSLGGVLGGIFNTLVAPFIFNSIIEYPLALVLSVLLRQEWRDTLKSFLRHLPKLIVLAVMMVGLALLSIWVSRQIAAGEFPQFYANALRGVVAAVSLGAIYISYRLMREHEGAFVLAVALICVGWSQAMHSYKNGNLLFQERSIFGVNWVTAMANNRIHTFFHGTTMHGTQILEDQYRLNPQSYYSRLSDVVALVDPARDLPMMGLGMGVGTVACLGHKGQAFDFYEIDPIVYKIANNPDLFTYLRDCPPKVNVILGDGRMKLSQMPDGHYGVMLMDAFSSDSIPNHLLTVEAVKMYLDKLAPGGVLAYHVSNRHIELRPVLSAIADELGLAALQRAHQPEDHEEFITASIWVVLTKDAATLAPLPREGRFAWEPMPRPDKAHFLWRDDFSNVLFSMIAVQKALGIGGVFQQPAAEEETALPAKPASK